MSLDFSKVLSALGEEAIGQTGEPLGLDKDQSNRVARALSARLGAGDEDAVAKAAADIGLDEEVVAAMMKKLIETGKERLLEESGVTQAVDNAKAEAVAALGNVGGEAVRNAGGMFGKLFGRKVG